MNMKQTKSDKVFSAINGILLILVSIICLYPYLNQFAISLNEGQDSMRGGITLIPRVFTLENYKAVFTNAGFCRSLIISVTRVILCTVISLIIIYSCAYGLTRKTMSKRAKKIITLYLMIPAYISAGVIPMYMNMRNLHLINNYLVYILPTLFVFYDMVIIRSFLQDLPPALEESAKIDGANDFVIMTRIIFPLSLPVVATVSLWIAVAAWNDWTTTLYYVTNSDLHTLQYLMMRLIKESEVVRQMAMEASMTGGSSSTVASTVTSESVKSATLIVSTLPIVMVYPFLQKYFIKGVTLGAVKE